MITMTIVTNSNPRGPGFWKLNTSFLSEDNYVTKIQNTIQDTKSEYANNPSVSPPLLWEIMKLKIREASLLYAKQREKEGADQADELEKTINTLQRTLEDKNIEGQLREQLLDVLKSKIEQYEMIIEYRAKDAILRSQSRGYNEGEKNTRYFLNLEKRHYKRGTISQLRINNDNFITKGSEILIECLFYFKNLYTTKLTDEQDPSINQFFFRK